MHPRTKLLVPLLLLTLLCAAPAGAAPAAPATEHAPSSLYDSSSPTMPAGAISVHPYAHEQLADGDSLDDYDSEPLTSIADPLEPWNRFWFAFNDIFFLHVAKPVYNFYETVVPQPIRGGVKNFYANILMPKRMINSLLQFRIGHAQRIVERFYKLRHSFAAKFCTGSFLCGDYNLVKVFEYSCRAKRAYIHNRKAARPKRPSSEIDGKQNAYNIKQKNRR